MLGLGLMSNFVFLTGKVLGYKEIDSLNERYFFSMRLSSYAATC